MPRDWYLCLRNVARHLAKGLDVQGLVHPDYMSQAWPVQDPGPCILHEQAPQPFHLAHKCITGVLGSFLIFLKVLELTAVFLGRQFFETSRTGNRY